jgi:hypothetical protein
MNGRVMRRMVSAVAAGCAAAAGQADVNVVVVRASVAAWTGSRQWQALEPESVNVYDGAGRNRQS